MKKQPLIKGQIGRIRGIQLIDVEDEDRAEVLRKNKPRTTRDKIYEALEKLTPKQQMKFKSTILDIKHFSNIANLLKKGKVL